MCYAAASNEGGDRCLLRIRSAVICRCLGRLLPPRCHRHYLALKATLTGAGSSLLHQVFQHHPGLDY